MSHGVDDRTLASARRRGCSGWLFLGSYDGTSTPGLDRILRGGVIAAVVLTVSGCDGPLSTLEPVGPVARPLAQLGWWVFAGGAVLLALMMGLRAIAAWRPLRGAQVSGRSWIIWGGLVLPALVLPPLVVVSLIAGVGLLPSDPVPRIEAEAGQWNWTFRYPDHGGTQTVDILHLPSGQPVDIIITSRDVIHSFWVPRLAGKMDAVPGRVNVLRLIAGAPGALEGHCAEFCGLEHGHMRFDVHVHDPAELAAVLSTSEIAQAP
ncbi:cytochrome c oxidase subunit II [Alkalilacustris brevis]|uniref:cytochrome c oxidase subunit II n=1 Tax=Alkalilacustris brevis TaxID=2026338 RepID=UPI001EE3D35E|nr:cytochrome B [Alkalilacustris brevis]